MSPIYLKFPDEATALKVLRAIGWHDGKQPTYHALDIRGTLYTRAVMVGKTVLVPASAKSGYHVNALVESVPKALVPYRVFPASPDVVFAGFHPDEIAARERKPK